MYVLGIWDGHDCGAAIVKGNQVLAAVNEERFTKNKLDIGFPTNSIQFCLDFLKLSPDQIKHIAINTSDAAKTFTRLFPSVKRYYYTFRRRKSKPRLVTLKREIKYKVTELPPTQLTKQLTLFYYRHELAKHGFKNFKLQLVDHHIAHAAAAAFTSGFKEAVVITLDGVGDGLSGSVNLFQNNQLKRISAIPARSSLGIFFEQVTNLLGMRELEDEGKVMALSDYSYKVPDKKNPLMKLFEVNGLNINTRYSSWQRYKLLEGVAWRAQNEDFAFMAQKVLETKALQLFKNAIKATGIKSVAWSGGVASNIKNNMSIRRDSGLKDWYVFPHMGDGGLALGSALYYNYQLTGTSDYEFSNLYFGPQYSEEDTLRVLKRNKGWLEFKKVKDIAKVAADAVVKDHIVMWFQGRMEYGPRALGNRSILASASSSEVKDRLNVHLKKRDWFQPFCPSVLAEDAKKLFQDYDKPDPFMTMGYKAKPSAIKYISAVLNVDNSARPQMLTDENPLYIKLLKHIQKATGYGIVLNTSFNIHGDPIVNTPEDAVSAMKRGGAKLLAIGDYWVKTK